MPVKNQSNDSRAKKPRATALQKKLRRQQVLMAVVGGVLILTMVLALVMK
jgi:hypothetical protein